MATRKLLDKDKALEVTTLSKEQLDSINNYSSQIVSLKDFVAAVRKRPGMYIGYKGNFGFIRMIREVLQNAIDEMVRKDSCGTTAVVTYYEGNRQIIIEDNGRGIPFGHIIRVFSKQHTGSNYEKKLFDYTSGTNGVGAKVSMALSKTFVVESSILGEARRVEFDDGTPWEQGELPVPNNNNRQGTMVSFTPSIEALGDITVTCEDIITLIKTLSPKTPVGSSIHFNGVKLDGTEIHDRITNEDGLMGIMINVCQKPMFEPIVFGGDTGEMCASVILDWDTSAAETGVEECVVSYANFCPTNSADSSHTRGFSAGVKDFFTGYMNNIYLNNSTSTKNSKSKNQKKPLKVIEADIRSGIRAVVDAAVLEPNFTGQAKDVLEVAEMVDYVKTMTMQALDEWSKTNPTQLNKLCKYFKEIAQLRTSQENKKVNISKSYKAGINGLPSKFVAPSKKWVELFIVEGDSAGGPCKNNRDVETQGIYPIRGMIKNCFEAKESECLANAEVAGILTLCGWEQKKKFDPMVDCKWEKLITAGDADSAGAQINALLLRLVLRFMPELILAGKFYRAVPPLYYVNRGKNKSKLYFSDKIALVKWVQAQFTKSNVIETIDGKKIAPSLLQEILYNNIDYIYELKKIADRYQLQEDILELYLLNRTKSEKEICKILKNKYRFMNPKTVRMPDGRDITVCEGSVNTVVNTVIFGDKMINESKEIIKILDGNLYDAFLINGQPGTIYDLMKIYTGFSPANLMRLKGLGEQDGKELAESLLLPGDGGNRTLIQYTMSDAMKEIDDIRRFESNKSLLLKDLKVSRLDITD